MRNSDKNRISLTDMILYAGLLLLSNPIILSFTTFLIEKLLMPFYNAVPYVVLAIISLILYIAMFLLVPIAIMYLFFHVRLPYQYQKKQPWKNSFLKLILPAEILRYFLCLESVGHIRQGGVFAILPSLIFENSYLIWTGRHNIVRNDLDYIFMDYFAYTVCYVIYALIYGALLAWVYHRCWEAEAEEQDVYIIHGN